MNLLLLKQIGAILLIATNVILLGWTIRLRRRRQSVPDPFYRLLTFSPLMAAFQATIGITLWVMGLAVRGQHLFYGIVIAVAALVQLLLGPRTIWGQIYRGRPMVYGFVALVIVLAAARSWLTA